jgi:hypothetical protein
MISLYLMSLRIDGTLKLGSVDVRLRLHTLAREGRERVRGVRVVETFLLARHDSRSLASAINYLNGTRLGDS